MESSILSIPTWTPRVRFGPCTATRFPPFQQATAAALQAHRCERAMWLYMCMHRRETMTTRQGKCQRKEGLDFTCHFAGGFLICGSLPSDSNGRHPSRLKSRFKSRDCSSLRLWEGKATGGSQLGVMLSADVC